MNHDLNRDITLDFKKYEMRKHGSTLPWCAVIFLTTRWLPNLTHRSFNQSYSKKKKKKRGKKRDRCTLIEQTDKKAPPSNHSKLLFAQFSKQSCRCSSIVSPLVLTRAWAFMRKLQILIKHFNALFFVFFSFSSYAAMKSGGTQLKLIMTFQNYGQALFKPMK